MTAPTPTRGPTAPRLPRRRWLLLAAAVAAGAAWVVLHLAADSDAGRERIRERAVQVLGQRVGPVEVGAARVDWLFRARVGPIAILPARPGLPAPVTVSEAVVRPRLGALLRGRVEPGVVVLDGVTVDLSRGLSTLDPLRRRLRGDASGPSSGGTGASAPLPEVRVAELRVKWPGRDDGPPLELGPFGLRLEVEREGASAGVHARLLLPAGGHLEVGWQRAAGGSELHLDGEASLPGDVPAPLLERLPVRPTSGSLRVDGEARWEGTAAAGTGRLRVVTRGVSVAGQALGPGPWGPFAASAEAPFRWSDGGRRVAVQAGWLALGPSDRVRASLSASLDRSAHPAVSAEVRATDVPWEELVAALPPELGPPDSAPRVAGPVSAFLRVALTPGQRGAEVEADLDLDALRRAVRAAGPSRLAGPFLWRPIDPAPGEPPREIAVGPGNPAFVPLAELPPHLVRAITASEDGGFFGHRGFDVREMANAVSERGLGRIRGASTITQQVAKNLFLSPDRTLARKVREALGTVVLEASLPKARILEVYLNIAEWGPGVYGVGEGARFWLGKDARDVTPREAAFLASVIPSPRRFHARYHRSGLTPWWRDRVADILAKMRQQGQLTEAQLAEALAEPLVPLDRQHPPDVNESEPPPAYADPAASEEAAAPE